MVAEPVQRIEIINEVHHPIFDLYKRSDGIVQLNTSDEAWFTVKEAREFVAALKFITEGSPHLILKIPGLRASVDKGARAYMATTEALQYSTAEAVLIRNIVQRMIGNLYLRIDKPVKPVRLFDSTEESIAWLKKQRK